MGGINTYLFLNYILSQSIGENYSRYKEVDLY